MQQTEPISTVEARKISPLVLIVLVIFLSAALLMILPSSRKSREAKARKRLLQDFPSSKDISYLYAATFVSESGFNPPKSKDHMMLLNVFAPKPSDPIPYDFFEGIRPQRYSGAVESAGWTCLLAPDPSATGWSLLAKVWIAKSLQKDSSYLRDMDMKARAISAGTSTTLTELRTLWSTIPPEIQAESERILEANRKVVKDNQGVRRYFVDSNGTNYEIRTKDTIWEFSSTFEEAFSRRFETEP